ncbi:MAG: serine hydrolase [Algicola sp.]|nr:serine hydrolase [Algicola sp.]
MKKTYFLILLTLFLSSQITYGQEKFVYPGDEWEYENAKCNPYSELRPFIIDSLNTTGLLIINNGKILFEYGDVKEISYLASARKSILSMMYGKYVTDGTINLNNTLKDLKIDDINPLTEEEKQATIEQIINARSGVYLPASNAGSGPNMPKRGQYKPGTHFYYNNWDFNVAGTIFEQETGKGIYQAFQEDIAIPLNLQDFELSNHRRTGNEKLSSHLAYHFHLSTRDMARLGYLMLRKGNWDGKQIIPEEWVEKTTTRVSKTNEYGLTTGYSHMWWLYSDSDLDLLEGAYTAAGAYGQYITVIPRLDIVIAHKTKSAYERVTSHKDYDNFILKLVKSAELNLKNNEIVDYEQFTGTYIDDSSSSQPMAFEMFIDDKILKVKGPIFPAPVVIDICNANRGILNAPNMGYPSLNFKRNEYGKIIGFNVLNIYIKKN